MALLLKDPQGLPQDLRWYFGNRHRANIFDRVKHCKLSQRIYGSPTYSFLCIYVPRINYSHDTSDFHLCYGIILLNVSSVCKIQSISPALEFKYLISKILDFIYLPTPFHPIFVLANILTHWILNSDTTSFSFCLAYGNCSEEIKAQARNRMFWHDDVLHASPSHSNRDDCAD